MKIRFGALSPLPSEQIKGLPVAFDDDASAITRALLRGIATDSEVKKMRDRLFKKIVSWVKQQKDVK